MFQSLNSFIQFRLLIVSPELVVHLQLVQQVCVYFFRYFRDSPFAESHFIAHYHVSQLDTLAEEFVREMFYYKSVRIFGVEQEGLHILCGLSEVVHQNALIQHHLYEMVFLMPFVVLIFFTGLLFYQYFEAFL